MKWRSTVLLSPSTVEIVSLCFNLIVRAVALLIAWSGLLFIGVGFDWVLELALSTLGASEVAKSALSQITLVYVLVIAISGTLSSTSVVIYLTKVDMRNLFSQASNTQDRGDNDAK